ncbi:MAG: hypothetical protein ABH986_02185 [archaeon]
MILRHENMLTEKTLMRSGERIHTKIKKQRFNNNNSFYSGRGGSMNETCNCTGKCYCQGIALIVIGLIGFLAYFNVWTMPYLAIIWPIIAVVVGIMSITGICCCSMKKK